jgi:hypothetical protein
LFNSFCSASRNCFCSLYISKIACIPSPPSPCPDWPALPCLPFCPFCPSPGLSPYSIFHFLTKTFLF